MDERLKYRLVGGLVLIAMALGLSFLLPAPEPEGRRAGAAVVIDLRAPAEEIARQIAPPPPPAAESAQDPAEAPVVAPEAPETLPVAPVPTPAQRPVAVPSPVPAIRPAPTPTTAPVAPADADAQRWWVQVGAYGAREGAEQVRETLRVVDLPAVVQSADVDGRTIHRVRIGPFDSRLAAESAQARAVLLGHTNATVFRQP